MTKLQKHHVGVLVEKNAFVDEGEGVVNFPKGLPITDNSEQRNGTKYDIKSMNIDEYKGQVTADHIDKLENIIAKVDGVQKVGNKVVVNSIRYAVKENPLANLAYNLLVNGFSTDFSIETYGPWPNEEDMTYYDSKLIGLSQVVIGNNKGAAVNSIVHNSLEQSKEYGLDVTALEEALSKELEITVNATHVNEEPNEVKDGKVQNEELEQEEEEQEIPEENTEVENKDLSKEVEEEAEEIKTPADPVDQPIPDSEKEVPKTPETPTEPNGENQTNNKNEEQHEMTFVTIKNSRDFPVTVTYKNAAGEELETVLEAGKTVDVSEDQKEALETAINGAAAPKAEEVDFAEIVKNAITPLADELAAVKKAFNEAAKEPAFKPADKKEEEKVENEFSKLDYRERHGKQINAAWEYLKLGSATAANTLQQINQVNLDALKKAEKVSNSLAISDFGNFVISPELLTDIQGFRNDYTALIDMTDWKETNSLQFAWLKRSGDINMQNVSIEPGQTGNGNLKPISQYTAEPIVSDLEELAAVTPVVNAATRFLAVDILGDIAKGYRNDFDKKRAQLVVARLQQAVDANSSHSIDYSVTPVTASLNAWSQLWAKVAETTVNGTFIFNLSTYAQIQQAIVSAGVSGPLSQIFTTGNQPTIFGRPYVIVPNDILPTLNSGTTVTVQVEGQNVVIDHAVFYFDPSNFTGRTSGGLQYDLSTEASYEQGGVVKSAYQRNELVLRGSFFRGGAVLDDARVSGMTSDTAPVAS